MKTIKLVSVLAILVCANMGFAHTDPKKEKPKSESISNEIQSLLGRSSLVVEEDVLAKVYFTINLKNEIVVLTVDSDSFALEAFIKSNLNYSKIKTKGIKQGKRYVIPVKLEAHK
ncbi:hypothetical protein [Snuella sedimenti]|uniref:Uncharacterized protein n=1 Tax=Snuella sedimenti TaxID=2798802 RepID=A0A8J7IG50_9FLAO|nr:hypothetical protein [Snuella sedimenti]MBJ6367158.1 hypothetical protein [Snuella sedimenti]